MPSSRSAPVVHKFGGAALEDAAALLHAARIVARMRAAERAPAVVVASAMRGVTDALLDVARRAARGDADGARAHAARLHQRHRAAAAELAPADAALAALVDASFAELDQIVGGL